MASKPWTTQYSAGLDTTTQMPTLVNEQDEALDSHFSTVSSSLILLETLLGSDLLETDSIRRAIQYSVQADLPPASPSIYDDEFDGPGLNPRWSWTYHGVPDEIDAVNGIAESWGLNNSRLYMVILDDYVAGKDWTWKVHALAQASPGPSTAWTATTKVITNWFVRYNSWSLWCNNGASKLVRLTVYFDSGTVPAVGVSWYNGSTWTYDQFKRFLGGKEVYLKMSYNGNPMAPTYYFYISYNGYTWVYMGSYATDWAPAVFGLGSSVEGASGLIGEIVGEYEYFRVVV